MRRCRSRLPWAGHRQSEWAWPLQGTGGLEGGGGTQGPPRPQLQSGSEGVKPSQAPADALHPLPHHTKDRVVWGLTSLSLGCARGSFDNPMGWGTGRLGWGRVLTAS